MRDGDRFPGLDLELLEERIGRMAELHEKKGESTSKAFSSRGSTAMTRVLTRRCQKQVEKQFRIDAEVEGPADEEPHCRLDQAEKEKLAPEVSPGMDFPKQVVAARN